MDRARKWHAVRMENRSEWAAQSGWGSGPVQVSSTDPHGAIAAPRWQHPHPRIPPTPPKTADHACSGVPVQGSPGLSVPANPQPTLISAGFLKAAGLESMLFLRSTSRNSNTRYSFLSSCTTSYRLRRGQAKGGPRVGVGVPPLPSPRLSPFSPIPQRPPQHSFQPNQSMARLESPDDVVMLELLEQGDLPDGSGGHSLLLGLQPGQPGGLGREGARPQRVGIDGFAVHRFDAKSLDPHPSPDLLECQQPVREAVLGSENHPVRSLPDFTNLLILRGKVERSKIRQRSVAGLGCRVSCPIMGPHSFPAWLWGGGHA